MKRGGTYTPNVFHKPTGLTETLMYQASLRLPQPDLPGAKGTPTPLYIRTSVQSAGTLMMTHDDNGNAVWSVALRGGRERT